MSQFNAFVELLKPHCIKDWQEKKILPSVIIAQAALESSFGLYAPDYNYFGIKTTEKRKGKSDTLNRYVDGEWVKIESTFKVYNSPEESLEEYYNYLMEDERYAGIIGEKDYKVVCDIIDKNDSDPTDKYGPLLKAVIESQELYLIDEEAFEIASINLSQDVIDTIAATWLKYEKDLIEGLYMAHKAPLEKQVADELINDYINPAYNIANTERQKQYLQYLKDELLQAVEFKA